VLHHVTAERPLELEWFAAESDVVETPGLRAECRGIAGFVGRDRVERMDYRAPASITGSPALARAGIGSMPIGTQRAIVDPAVRYRGDHLFAITAQHRGGHGGRSQPHQDHMIHAGAIEGIPER